MSGTSEENEYKDRTVEGERRLRTQTRLGRVVDLPRGCQGQGTPREGGRRGDAVTLYNKRKAEALQRNKLPENFRAKGITFADPMVRT